MTLSDIPSFRGWDGSKCVYWTTADPQPIGVTDITKMPIQGISGTISPYSLPDMLFWYRADYGVERTSTNTVVQWKDLSGNGWHVAPQNPGLLTGPTHVSNSVNLNNQPSVIFERTAGNVLWGATSSLLSPPNLTIVAMVVLGTASGSANTYDTFISKTDTGSWFNGWSMGSRSSGSANGFWFNGWNNFIERSYGPPPPVKKILATGRTSNVIIYRSNGNLVNTIS